MVYDTVDFMKVNKGDGGGGGDDDDDDDDDQPVNDVLGNNPLFLSYETHKYAPWVICRVF